MLYLANPCGGAAVREAMTAGHLGWLASPGQRNTLNPATRWAADNGCFSSHYVGDARWFDWLGRYHPEARSLCLFATAPDVVGDAVATLQRSAPWLPRIRGLGYPAALVAQDGLEDRLDAVPWADLDALFIGGTTDWKLGPGAAEAAREAKARGLWLHMGRVNSRKRLRIAHALGCDSADGTYLTFGPDRNLPRLLTWLAEVHAPPAPPPQLTLW